MMTTIDTTEALNDPNRYCCHKCFNKHGGFLTRMLLCPTCGNKRCPKATDHDLACTDSNEPNQPGSIYGGLHVEAQPNE